ncbi:hypothetical protein OAE87_01450 [bacterium]|nr:hypothetical protein [bacterium]
MALRASFKKFIDSYFFQNLTCFQGSSVRFFYSYLYLNIGKSPWMCIQGSNHKVSSLNYKYELEQPRGRSHDDKFYSYGYSDSSFETIQVFNSIILDHFDDIEKVIGPGFLLADPTFWRTTHIPENLSSYDIYSQVFHQDSVVDNFNIQIFVLLQDVTSLDGPFEWIDKDHHRKAFNKCRKRDKIVVDDVLVSKLLGKRNDYLILSTGQTLHRDGIPNYDRERVMASIGLFPKYTKIGKPLQIG